VSYLLRDRHCASGKRDRYSMEPPRRKCKPIDRLALLVELSQVLCVCVSWLSCNGVRSIKLSVARDTLGKLRRLRSHHAHSQAGPTAIPLDAHHLAPAAQEWDYGARQLVRGNAGPQPRGAHCRELNVFSSITTAARYLSPANFAQLPTIRSDEMCM
jgi:hypothetical protein